MTLEDLLNIADDETWVKVGFAHEVRAPVYVWGADWIGGHKPTLDEVAPWLGREVDDLRVVEGPDPELEGEATQMLNVTVY